MGEADRVPCPYCGESIASTARKCRFCGEWLPGANSTLPIEQQAPPEAVPVTVASTELESIASVEEPAVEVEPQRTRPNRLTLLIPGAAIAIGTLLIAPWAGDLGDAFWYRALVAAVVALLLIAVTAVVTWLVIALWSRVRGRERRSFGEVVRLKRVALIGVALCFFSAVGQRQGEEDAASAAAVRTGVVSSAADADPVDRCIGLILDDPRLGEVVTLLPKGASVRGFGRSVCELAEQEGALAGSGLIASSDGLTRATCVEVTMMGYDTIPVSYRRFSKRDYRAVTTRYCRQAVAQNLMRSTEAKREALQQRIIEAMLASGEISELSDKRPRMRFRVLWLTLAAISRTAPGTAPDRNTDTYGTNRTAWLSQSAWLLGLIWARLDSNQGPTDYESAALTS